MSMVIISGNYTVLWKVSVDEHNKPVVPHVDSVQALLLRTFLERALANLLFEVVLGLPFQVQGFLSPVRNWRSEQEGRKDDLPDHWPS